MITATEPLRVDKLAEQLGVPVVTVSRLVSDLCAEQGHELVVERVAGSMRATVLFPATASEIARRLAPSVPAAAQTTTGRRTVRRAA